MNPTDQASKTRNHKNVWESELKKYFLILGKEARKKELKKNKKQRQMVRQAVLKNKDPSQLLEEMEQIDEMGKKCSRVQCSRSSGSNLIPFRIQRSAALTTQ